MHHNVGNRRVRYVAGGAAAVCRSRCWLGYHNQATADSCTSGVPWTAKARSLDILVQPRRDRKAALKLMRKLMKKQGVTPATIVTDKLGSYSSALRELGVARRHDTGRWKNNRAKNSHQPLRQRERRMNGNVEQAFPSE